MRPYKQYLEQRLPMKSLRFYDINDLRLENADRPVSAPGEIRLKTASVGICGSDIHYYCEGSTDGQKLGHPLVLGHEFSAWIDEGPDKGQLVAVDPALPCGRCEFCQEGNPNLCSELRFAGSDETDGALREYLTWPVTALYPLPPGFTPQEGALLEPLGVAIHATRLGKISPGMTVGVFGSGAIGLLTIQMAKLAGASRIFATDRLDQRLVYAQKSGATDVLPADGNEAGRILAETNGRGLDIVFEAAGDDGMAVESSIESAKRGAMVVLIGIPSKDETTFSASSARRRGLTIKIARRMKHTYPTAIRLVSQGKVDLKSLITHEYALVHFQSAFETAARREGIKVIINL
ncbi:MAG TPA: alcohol dehydrogenase [Anaerolineaceae bacterium]|nr:alcohol dehydrogenase [Anaerolineaceae bacterium]